MPGSGGRTHAPDAHSWRSVGRHQGSLSVNSKAGLGAQRIVVLLVISERAVVYDAESFTNHMNRVRIGRITGGSFHTGVVQYGA